MIKFCRYFESFNPSTLKRFNFRFFFESLRRYEKNIGKWRQMNAVKILGLQLDSYPTSSWVNMLRFHEKVKWIFFLFLIFFVLTCHSRQHETKKPSCDFFTLFRSKTICKNEKIECFEFFEMKKQKALSFIMS